MVANDKHDNKNGSDSESNNNGEIGNVCYDNKGIIDNDDDHDAYKLRQVEEQ